MKILITGGLGFIGSHLAERLVSEGNDVHIYDNLSNAKVSRVDGAKWCMDFRHEQWDLVYHLAAVAQIEQGYNHELIKSNILLASEVLSLPTKIIYASSASTKQPKALYAYSKMFNDAYAQNNPQAYGVMFENVYGPRDNGVIGKVLKACINKTPFTLNGGNQQRDFVHVSDVVNALCWAIHNNGQKITPIGTGIVHNIHEVIQIAERLTGSPLDYDYAPLGDHEIEYSICEKPLKNFITLEEGMRKYYLSLTV